MNNNDEHINVIIVNGFPQSGKDTFIQMCLDILGPYGEQISTVDAIKEFAKFAGWNGEKDLQSRKALSDIKDIMTEWLDLPYKEVKKAIRSLELEADTYGLNYNDFFLFVHSREPDEIKRFVDDFGAKTLLIVRPGMEKQELNNHADKDVLLLNYDYSILNNGSLEKLEESAKFFISRIRGELR